MNEGCVFVIDPITWEGEQGISRSPRCEIHHPGPPPRFPECHKIATWTTGVMAFAQTLDICGRRPG